MFVFFFRTTTIIPPLFGMSTPTSTKMSAKQRELQEQIARLQRESEVEDKRVEEEERRARLEVEERARRAAAEAADAEAERNRVEADKERKRKQDVAREQHRMLATVRKNAEASGSGKKKVVTEVPSLAEMRRIRVQIWSGKVVSGWFLFFFMLIIPF